jgi:hypothetical protein
LSVTYQAWETADGSVFTRADNLEEIKRIGADELLRLEFEVTAETFEEAMSIYHLRKGFEPYVPTGKPARCPVCAAWYYPGGSGQCWRSDSHGK